MRAHLSTVLLFVVLFQTFVGLSAGSGFNYIEILDQVSMERLESDLQALTSFYTRFTVTPYINESAYFLAEKLEEAGADVHLEYYRLSWRDTVVTVPNVVGEFPGDDEIVVFSAHFDSVNWEDTSKRAPGADDDGSGVVALLEVARIVSCLKLKHTFRIVFFSGEELGLFGSRAYVAEHRGENIKFNVQLDMVAKDRPTGIWVGTSQSRNPSEEEMNLAEAALTLAETIGVDAEIMYGRYEFSDHASFLKAGIPAICIMDSKAFSNTYIHSDRDTIKNNVDFEILADNTRLTLALACMLAEAEGMVDMNLEEWKLKAAPDSDIVYGTYDRASAMKIKVAFEIKGEIVDEDTGRNLLAVGGPLACETSEEYDSVAGVAFEYGDGSITLKVNGMSWTYTRQDWAKRDYGVIRLYKDVENARWIVFVEGCTRYGTQAATLFLIGGKIGQSTTVVVMWTDKNGDKIVTIDECRLVYKS